MESGRKKTKSLPNESSYEYNKRYKRELYKTNPQYTAKKKMLYYMKLYKDNKAFQDIIENEEDVIERLLKVCQFHQKMKLNLL